MMKERQEKCSQLPLFSLLLSMMRLFIMDRSLKFNWIFFCWIRCSVYFSSLVHNQISYNGHFLFYFLELFKLFPLHMVYSPNDNLCQKAFESCMPLNASEPLYIEVVYSLNCKKLFPLHIVYSSNDNLCQKAFESCMPLNASEPLYIDMVYSLNCKHGQKAF